jgi:hypothetical protein
MSSRQQKLVQIRTQDGRKNHLTVRIFVITKEQLNAVSHTLMNSIPDLPTTAATQCQVIKHFEFLLILSFASTLSVNDKHLHISSSSFSFAAAWNSLNLR